MFRFIVFLFCIWIVLQYYGLNNSVVFVLFCVSTIFEFELCFYICSFLRGNVRSCVLVLITQKFAYLQLHIGFKFFVYIYLYMFNRIY